MLTYNHDKYIREAIESVLMQEVSFDYEIVIGEDCSTDNTRNILIEYKNKYPNRIKLLLHEKNVGAALNDIEVSRNCSGEYIAILEGDDYWSDKKKLQKSVDFLESNIDFIAVAHDVYVIDENRESVADTPYGSYKGDLVTPLDQFKYNNIPTLSLVFRNVWGKEFASTKSEIQKNVIIVGDYPFKLLLLTKGKIKYLNEKMGTYRWVRSGGTSFSSRQEKEVNLFYIDLIQGLNNLCGMNTTYNSLFKRKIRKMKATVMWNFIVAKEIRLLKKFLLNSNSKNNIGECLGVSSWFIFMFIRKIIKIILRLLRLLK